MLFLLIHSETIYPRSPTILLPSLNNSLLPHISVILHSIPSIAIISLLIFQSHIQLSSSPHTKLLTYMIASFPPIQYPSGILFQYTISCSFLSNYHKRPISHVFLQTNSQILLSLANSVLFLLPIAICQIRYVSPLNCRINA